MEMAKCLAPLKSETRIKTVWLRVWVIEQLNMLGLRRFVCGNEVYGGI